MTDASTTMDEGGDKEEDEGDGERQMRLVLPEDGYEWKKYGQKFIKSIGRNRSYFKCQREDCRAKKRAEWSSMNSGDMRIVYDGVHNHNNNNNNQSQGTSSSSSSNQYNLLNQLLTRNQSETPPQN